MTGCTARCGCSSRDDMRPECQTFLGGLLYIDREMPFGRAERRQPDLGPQDQWTVSYETYLALREDVQAVAGRAILSKAKRNGTDMVEGVVCNRPPRNPERVRRSHLDELAKRARKLMVEIATAMDKGLSQDQLYDYTVRYAALQEERNEVVDQLAGIDADLAIGRALVIMEGDPVLATAREA